MSNMAVSIIIPVKDQIQYLQNLLKTIRQHAPADIPYEVIVVDDGSQPPLQSDALPLPCRIIRIETSGGPAAARNCGAQAACGTILFFMDADVEYAPGVIQKICTTLEEHPDAAALSFINQSFTKGDSFIRSYGALIERFWFNAMLGNSGDVGNILGVTSRNGAVRKTAFQAVGGFDDRFKTNAHEDYDFGKRLSAVYPVLLTRTPTIYHRFPDRLMRLLRNYWVRASLFVPYYIQKRPALDKAQSSPQEALLRMLAAAVPPLVVLGFLPVPLGSMALGAAALALVLYAWGARRFIVAAAAESASVGFAAKALAVHYLTSLVITAGGIWGLFRYVTSSNPENHADAAS